ncbi:MAG: hypothetical protein AABX53_00175 [Nanoarchaeota archaeon]
MGYSITMKKITRAEDISGLERGDLVHLFRDFPVKGLEEKARVVEKKSNKIGLITQIKGKEELYVFQFITSDLRSRTGETLGSRTDVRNTYRAEIIQTTDPEYEYYKSFLEETTQP